MIKKIIWYVLAELFLAIVIVIIAVNYPEAEYYQQIYKNGVTAEATIVNVKMRSSGGRGGAGGYYVTCYRYVDENGIEYTGGAYYTSNLDEANSYLDSKVTIYIDGKGESFWEGRIPTRPWEAIIILIVVSAVFVGMNVLFVRHWWIKKKHRKKAEEAVVAEGVEPDEKTEKTGNGKESKKKRK